MLRCVASSLCYDNFVTLAIIDIVIEILKARTCKNVVSFDFLYCIGKHNDTNRSTTDLLYAISPFKCKNECIVAKLMFWCWFCNTFCWRPYWWLSISIVQSLWWWQTHLKPSLRKDPKQNTQQACAQKSSNSTNNYCFCVLDLFPCVRQVTAWVGPWNRIICYFFSPSQLPSPRDD